MNNSLIVEGDVRVKKGSIGQLKDGSIFLLNEVEVNLYDKPIKRVYGETEI